MYAKAMDAAGYDEHSLAQAALHDLASPMLRAAASAAAKIALQSNSLCIEVLVVGPATGKNDCAALKKDVLPEMRAVAPSLPIRVLFADLPDNDWPVLMNEIRNVEGVSCSACMGISYDRITVAESLHLVLTFSTLHWIRELPKDVGKTDFGQYISYTTMPKEASMQVRQIANKEMRGFFLQRMIELAPGGRVVVACDGETPDEPHQFSRTYLLLEEVLKTEKSLPADLITNFFCATVPYLDESLRPDLVGDGWESIEYAAMKIPCPYHLAWKASSDAANHGREVAGATMACFRKPLEEALLKSGASAADIPQHLTKIQARAAELAAAQPDKYNTAGVTSFIHVAKPTAKEGSAGN